MEQQTDDGSLAFLNIPRDENNRSFNCDETSQSKLVNTEFWIIDFIEEVPTRFSKSKGTKGQTLVKIKKRLEDPESDAKKFYREQKLMRKSIKKNFCRAVSRINKRNPPLDAKAYKQAVAPWLGWAKHSDSKHLLQTILRKDYYDTCVLRHKAA